MKSIGKFASLFGVAVLLAGVVGCSSGGGAAEVGKPLYAQLGRADGVTKLANQFGANIASNPALNSILDAAAIGNLQTGLTNDIIKVSGMTPPNGTTLTSALQGKGLDKNGFDALSKSLTDAGTAQGLDSTVLGTLTSKLMGPAKKSLGL